MFALILMLAFFVMTINAAALPPESHQINCTVHRAPPNDEASSIASRLVKRASVRNMDCTLTALVDPFYLGSFGTTDATKALAMATAEIHTVMRQVNEIYMRELGVGIPLVKIIPIDQSRDEGMGLGVPTGDIDALLKKLDRAVGSDRGIFRGLKQSCLVHLFTHQNFGDTLGSAYLSENGGGGICDKRGFNAAIVNSQFRKAKIPVAKLSSAMAHEVGHGFGSAHDEGRCSGGNTPFLMFPTVRGAANEIRFSSCSLASIQRSLQRHATCFLKHGTFPYAQYNGAVPMFASTTPQ